jgi:hypothetical protein
MDGFKELLKGICTRAHMYVPHGDFCEVVSFITGYAAGRQLGTSYIDGELHAFSVWMAKRFGLAASNWVWWNVLLHGFDNNEGRALAELPGLYDAFVAARSPKART